MSKHFEDKSREYAAINDDKAANLAMSYNKYDIADAFQNGFEFANEWHDYSEIPKESGFIILEFEGCYGVKDYTVYKFNKDHIAGIVTRWRYLI